MNRKLINAVSLNKIKNYFEQTSKVRFFFLKYHPMTNPPVSNVIQQRNCLTFGNPIVNELELSASQAIQY
jgi:hypothetical protein